MPHTKNRILKKKLDCNQLRSLNKDQIITAVNDILPRAQVCIESNLMEGHLSTN